ncbi:MAG: hypothetical protein IPK32_20960 [Verrucomicrobiaceae bacterium]|nr:hypothetical protein [Verrucomicrobiaceae bacterium]
MNRRLILTLLAGLLSLTSCKDMTQAKSLADTAIVDFHKKFNEQKFKELYNSAHPDLRAAATEADFLKLLEAIHRKLGKHMHSNGAGWRVNTFNMKTSVVITQNTEFEQGKGVETFTFVVSGGSCTLQGYNINSQDMMTK